MRTKDIVLTGLFIALGLVLPMAFHGVTNAGSIFAPMHIPVLVCGMLLGPVCGGICGLLTPILSSVLTGMPPAPVLPAMAVELTVYGLMTGLLMRTLKMEDSLVKNYVVLILAMLCGRIIAGLVRALILNAGSYSMAAWVTAYFVTGLPGIGIQLVLIPAIVRALQKSGIAR